MKSKKLVTIIMAIGLVLTSYNIYSQTAEELLPKAIQLEEVKGELFEAIKMYQLILNQYSTNREVSAEALLHLGICYEKLGLGQARQTYREVISKYPDQGEKVAMARDRISRLDVYTADLIARAEQHLKNGNELFKNWEYESAVREYENAVRLNPESHLALNARYCIGQSWYRAGEYNKALTTFTKLIEENPKNNIVPVTELMISQIRSEIDRDKNRQIIKNPDDENIIIDPATGITYKKVRSFAGKNDLIDNTSGGFNVSPDGRFMVEENKVVPMDGSDAFNLTKMDATRAVYSPDMKKAAFYANRSIWIMPVSPETGKSTGEPVKLLEGQFKNQGLVSWSPDGEKLAIGRGSGNIWTISVKDGELKRITEPSVQGVTPVWSPDGKLLAFRSEMNLCMTLIDGTGSRLLVKNSGTPKFWSKDNKWFFHANFEKNHLYSMDQDKDFEIIRPKQVGNFIAFSPDNTKMLFYRPSYDFKNELKVVSADGGPFFEPGRNFEIYGAAWSPDSKRVFARSVDDNGNGIYRIVPLLGEKSNILDINVNLKGKTYPWDVSPDNKKLALTLTCDNGNIDIYIVPVSVEEARTSGPAKLVFENWTGGYYNVHWSWSANGSNIAIIHDKNIWIIPLQGGKPYQVTNTPEDKRDVKWSPDGSMISFFSYPDKKITLNVIPASGGNSIAVAEDCKDYYSWSPDSKGLLIISGSKMLHIGPDGNLIRQYIYQNDHGITIMLYPEWSPDGKYFAFIGPKEGDEYQRVFVVSAKDGKLTEIVSDDNTYKDFLTWSPDGKWISYISNGLVKMRPEGTLWEADFKDILEKLSK